MKALQHLSRWKAAGIHLLISFAIAGTVLAAMFFIWYPEPYMTALGGITVFLLVVGVDVSLGPLLTLVVFNPKKKSLKMDLSIIAALQVAALVYGLSVMLQARPVYLTFADDRFELVRANDIDVQSATKARYEEFARIPWWGPKIAAAHYELKVAGDSEQLVQELAKTYPERAHVQNLPEYYLPYEKRKAVAAAKGMPISALRKEHPEASDVIDAAIAATGRKEDALRFLPMWATAKNMSVLLAADTGDIVGFAPVSIGPDGAP